MLESINFEDVIWISLQFLPKIYIEFMPRYFSELRDNTFTDQDLEFLNINKPNFEKAYQFHLFTLYFPIQVACLQNLSYLELIFHRMIAFKRYFLSI